MPRSISEVLALAGRGEIAISGGVPYSWNKGAHDVDYTASNTLAIAFMMIFEKADPPKVTAEDLGSLKERAEEESAGEDVLEAYAKARVEHMIADNWKAYSSAFLMLVCCHQVRPLDSGNLENFCSMSGAPPASAKTLTFLSYFAARMPRIIGNAGVVELFKKNRYFQYHTTASATPYLMKQAVEESAGLPVFTYSEIAAVATAAEKPDDLELARQIPELTLVKGHAVLAAAGGLPETWYMGQRAKDRYSAKRYTALKKLLIRYFALETDLDGLEEMGKEAVVGSLSKLLLGFATGGPVATEDDEDQEEEEEEEEEEDEAE